MRLTKTDFIHYLNCPKSLWLKKREPQNYPAGEFSAFQQKLAREGNEVEDYFQQYFADQGNGRVRFQVEFGGAEGPYARADGFEVDKNGAAILYEVKSSTSVKEEARNNHVKDACFQKICAARVQQQIDRVVLVHLNGGYLRDGDIEPAELLHFEDITERVAAIEEETNREVDAAIECLEGEIDRRGCSCLEKTRGHHCDSFDYFNPGLPVPSIYSLPNLRPQKLAELRDAGITDPTDIPADFDLPARQWQFVCAVQAGEPQVDRDQLQAFMDTLRFPLYFLDYETYQSAIPLIDGTGPHKPFTVQFSLHILEENGNLAHHEYLEREARLPDRLLGTLSERIGPEGSVIVWHATFERHRNNDMAAIYEEHAEFLNGLNERMVDLENPFKTDYVDAGFNGSSSIKKVLPVVCPHLNYDGLEVQDGTAAMEAWKRMIEAEPDEADRIAENLRRYCELDTLAMVEIYRFLRDQLALMRRR